MTRSPRVPRPPGLVAAGRWPASRLSASGAEMPKSLRGLNVLYCGWLWHSGSGAGFMGVGDLANARPLLLDCRRREEMSALRENAPCRARPSRCRLSRAGRLTVEARSSCGMTVAVRDDAPDGEEVMLCHTEAGPPGGNGAAEITYRAAGGSGAVAPSPASATRTVRGVCVKEKNHELAGSTALARPSWKPAGRSSHSPLGALRTRRSPSRRPTGPQHGASMTRIRSHAVHAVGACRSVIAGWSICPPVRQGRPR